MNLEIHIRQFREEIGQILEWIQSVRLAGLNHAVGRSAGCGSLRGSTEQPVLTPYGKVPDGSFTDIVGHGSFATTQIDGQALLMIQDVVYSLAQSRFRCCFRLDCFQPYEQSLQLVFFKPQAFLLSVSDGQLCQVLVPVQTAH